MSDSDGPAPGEDDTPLMAASRAGDVEAVRSALAGGAAPNAPKPTNGVTAVFLGAQGGHDAVVRTLFEAGADLNGTTDDGATPLLAAAQNGHLEVVRTVVGYCKAALADADQDGCTALWLAAFEGHAEVVDALAVAGADVGRADTLNRSTPAYVAAQNGHLDVLKVLLRHGADVTSPCRGTTPASIARDEGFDDVAEFLLSLEGRETSRLGTRDYWEGIYSSELRGFEERHDVGHVWFGSQSQHDMCAYIDSFVTDKAAPVLDLGCGNGCLAVELLQRGWLNVTASDYVQESVTMATQVAEHAGFATTAAEATADGDREYTLRIVQDDMTASALAPSSFQAVFDKGTLDAFMLLPSHTMQLYASCVHRLLAPGGFLIITSCNHTIEDMKTGLESLHWLGEFPQKQTFTFGGVAGSTHVTTAFQKPRESSK